MIRCFLFLYNLKFVISNGPFLPCNIGEYLCIPGSITKCTPGYCYECPINTYQPTNMYSGSLCTSCPEFYFTDNFGSALCLPVPTSLPTSYPSSSPLLLPTSSPTTAPSHRPTSSHPLSALNDMNNMYMIIIIILISVIVLIVAYVYYQLLPHNQYQTLENNNEINTPTKNKSDLNGYHDIELSSRASKVSTSSLIGPEWTDDCQQYCEQCNSNFTVINRRHHCRKCGLIVCQACSSNQAIIPSSSCKEPVRVCDVCFGHISFDPTHFNSLDNSHSPDQTVDELYELYQNPTSSTEFNERTPIGKLSFSTPQKKPLPARRPSLSNSVVRKKSLSIQTSSASSEPLTSKKDENESFIYSNNI